MPHRKAAHAIWANLAVIALFVAAASSVLVLVLNNHRISDNQSRIREIQESRVSSCRQTYEGIRDVFKPFFRPMTDRTAKERKDIRKFNRVINRLKAGCDTQTGGER